MGITKPVIQVLVNGQSETGNYKPECINGNTKFNFKKTLKHNLTQ